jgi:hypothetical protein
VGRHVAHEAEHVVGDESSDGAAGVDRGEDPPRRIEYESRGLDVLRLPIRVRAGRCGEGVGIGAVAHAEGETELPHQRRGGRLVVDGERDHLDPERGERVVGAREARELRVAVRA